MQSKVQRLLYFNYWFYFYFLKIFENQDFSGSRGCRLKTQRTRWTPGVGGGPRHCRLQARNSKDSSRDSGRDAATPGTPGPSQSRAACPRRVRMPASRRAVCAPDNYIILQAIVAQPRWSGQADGRRTGGAGRSEARRRSEREYTRSIQTPFGVLRSAYVSTASSMRPQQGPQPWRGWQPGSGRAEAQAT